MGLLLGDGVIVAARIVDTYEDDDQARVTFRPWGTGVTVASAVDAVRALAIVAKADWESVRAIGDRQRKEWR